MKTIKINCQQLKKLKDYIKMHSSKKVYLITEFGRSKSQDAIDVYPLTENNVELIPDDAMFGNYRIGIVKGDGFWVRYFGRSDNNQGGLRQRVKDHIGDTMTNKEKRVYDKSHYFWFEVKSSAEEAYEQECKDYHAIKVPDEDNFVDNEKHPDKPNGMSSLFCPGCNQ